MQPRLVLRIERDGQLLGSWSLQDAPLEMSMVDLGTGRVVARFTASAEILAMVDRPVTPPPPPRRGQLDELPVDAAVHRLDGDDFTMPLPEPTDESLRDLPETEERRVLPRSPTPNIARPVVPTRRGGDGLTSELQLVDDGLVDEGTGLTRDLQPIDDGLSAEGTGLTSELIPDDGRGGSHDEMPVPAGADGDAGLTGELRTATVDLPDDARPTIPIEDEPSLTAKVERFRPRVASATDPEHTPRARISPPPRRPPAPQPAEVWSQKRGEWKSLGHLVPGQRVSTLGGWVRLAPDGRLVVRSGQNLAGTATLVDGRMIEIETSEDYLALPPGSSVMLAVGDRGIYVRSEPLPEHQGRAARR